ncbi:MAG: ComEC/Rec2 family competence protein [Daejeonella sp.]
MKISFLKAFQGDCIHITLKDSLGHPRHILIDGGIGDTYRKMKGPKGKPVDGELKLLIDQIKKKDQLIDLLIITHVDDDHIGGILGWFAAEPDAYKMISEVWFNSGKKIANWLKEKENEDVNRKFNDGSALATSIKQGIDFGKYIYEKGILSEKIVIQGDTFEKFGLKFKILSPNKKKLEKLLKEWKIKDPLLQTSGKPNDYLKTISQHIADDSFSEDNAFPNGSSIAFILSAGEKEFLFLGDAHPTVIVEGLDLFGYNEATPLIAEFVKVSHHGSKSNTNINLLTGVSCDKYVISTNGDENQHPHKQLLARILNRNPSCSLYFNYTERMDIIFSPDDLVKYNKMKLLEVSDEFKYDN